MNYDKLREQVEAMKKPLPTNELEDIALALHPDSPEVQAKRRIRDDKLFLKHYENAVQHATIDDVLTLIDTLEKEQTPHHGACVLGEHDKCPVSIKDFVCSCECHTPPHTGEWEAALQFEVMEDYLRHAELLYAAKDKKAAMEEMRQHFDKLINFIRTEIERARQEGAAAERERLVEQLKLAVFAIREGNKQRNDLYGEKLWEEWMLKNISYRVERLQGVEDAIRWIEKGYLPGASTAPSPKNV